MITTDSTFHLQVLLALIIALALNVLFSGRALAEGPGTRARDWWTPAPISETLSIRVLDVETDEAVRGASVYAGSGVYRVSSDGTAALPATAGPLLIVAPFYQPDAVSAVDEGASSSVVVRLRPALPRLRVVDARTGRPLIGATLAGDERWIRTDANGYVPLPVPIHTPLVVKYGGYRRVVLERVPADREVELTPFVTRGIYLSFNWLNRSRARLVELLDRARDAGLNTVVVDAKSDRGFLGWNSEHPDAAVSGVNARSETPLQEFLGLARERDFYVIARVVVFKDNPLAFARPARAVRRADGSVWIDGEELGWANPLLRKNWDYNATLARELAEMGFDEVNLDYIRFPTDGDIEAIQWEDEPDEQERVNTINAFLRVMEQAVRSTPALLSGDVFGLVPTVYGSDMGIGQIVEEMAPHLDLFCPMTYPATYWPGNMGVADPLRQPYDTVFRATQEAVLRSEAPVRPWLQAYSWAGVTYGPEMLDAQIRAAEDAGAVGWIFWSASGKYETLFTYLENRP